MIVSAACMTCEWTDFAEQSGDMFEHFKEHGHSQYRLYDGYSVGEIEIKKQEPR